MHDHGTHDAITVPGAASNILHLAGRELRDAMRSRWFLLYTLAFVVLGLGVSYVSAAAAGGSGLSGFGRTTAGLINLVILVVPLMALSAGAGSIASDRERGMLAYLLAQPTTRMELLLGKFLGLAAVMLASVCLGFGVCAGILAWKGSSSSPATLLWLVGLTFLLSLGMLACGLLISASTRRSGAAQGVAIFAWLTLVFVSDLGIMAGAVAMRMRIETLFALCVANPVQAFKMWALVNADTSLDVLGPAGLYAQDEWGPRVAWLFAGVLVAWIVVPLGVAAAVFARRPLA
ncbi:MAG: ABC transporter permease subunit [Phycisphaerales bacterium]